MDRTTPNQSLFPRHHLLKYVVGSDRAARVAASPARSRVRASPRQARPGRSPGPNQTPLSDRRFGRPHSHPERNQRPRRPRGTRGLAASSLSLSLAKASSSFLASPRPWLARRRPRPAGPGWLGWPPARPSWLSASRSTGRGRRAPMHPHRLALLD
jgi:hypothetical protein